MTSHNHASPHAHQAQIYIIGAGIAGLTAAMTLADAGVPVTILESSAHPGGRARSLNHADLAINQGAHALYLHGALNQALKRWRLPIHHHEPRIDLNVVTLEQAQHPLPSTPYQLWKAPWLKGAHWQAVRALTSLMTTRPQRHHALSALDWINQQTTSTPVRQLLGALFRLTNYTGALDLIPAQAAIPQLRLGLRGVTYVDYGWQQLIDVLTKRLHDTKLVEIRYGCAVRRITRDDSSNMTIHTKDNQDLAASHIIMATSPHRAIKWLTWSMPERDIQAALKQQRPTTVATLDMVMSNEAPKGAPLALGLDQPLYFSDVTATAPHHLGDATSPAHIWHMVHYSPQNATTSPDDVMTTWLDQLRPGWRQHVKHRVYRPSMQTMSALAPVEEAPIPVTWDTHLHCASDGTGAHGALADRSVASAQRAARHVIETLHPNANTFRGHRRHAS